MPRDHLVHGILSPLRIRSVSSLPEPVLPEPRIYPRGEKSLFDPRSASAAVQEAEGVLIHNGGISLPDDARPGLTACVA